MNDSRDAWIAAALRSRSEDSQPRQDCPHPERIWSAVRLELPLDERLVIIDHIAECAPCAESWRLAAELAAAHEETVPTYLRELQEQVAAPSRPLVWNVYAGRSTFAVVALVLLVVVAALLLRVSAPDVNPAGRDAGVAASSARGGDSPPPSSVEPVEQRPQEIDDFRLRWFAGPKGSTYDLTVTTADMDVVAEARGLTVPEYRVPVRQLMSVTPGTPLLWGALVHMPEGATVSTLFTGWTLVSVPPSDPAPVTDASDLVAIMRVIDTYRRALETEDLMMYKTVRPGLTPEADAVLRKNFSERDYLDVSIGLGNMPRVADGTAFVGIARRDTFIVRADPQQQVQTEAIPESLSLEKTSTGWVILH